MYHRCGNEACPAFMRLLPSGPGTCIDCDQPMYATTALLSIELQGIAEETGVVFEGPDDEGLDLFIALADAQRLVCEYMGKEYAERPLAELLPEVARAFNWPALRLQRAAESVWDNAVVFLNVKPSRLRVRHDDSGITYEIERIGPNLVIRFEVGEVWGRFLYGPKWTSDDRCLYESGAEGGGLLGRAEFMIRDHDEFPATCAQHIESLPAHEWELLM